MKGIYFLIPLILLVFVCPLAGALAPHDDLYPSNTLYPSNITNGAFTIRANQLSVNEADTSITLTIDKTPCDFNSTVNLNTTNGTALSGADFLELNENLSFNWNETSKTVLLSIKDDDDTEGSEYFIVALSNPTGNATLGTPYTVTITIVNRLSGNLDQANRMGNMGLLLIVMVGIFIVLYVLGSLVMITQTGFDPKVFAIVIGAGVILGIMLISFVVLSYLNGEIYTAIRAFTP